MLERLEKLERRQRWLARYGAVVSALLLIAVVSGFVSRQDPVLRVRGIVVVDEAGRERILIGAPIPGAKNRVRTDLTRVEALWARRYPDPKQYMGYYAKYQNEMNGVLMLDEEGFDRVGVGDPVPDPNIGRRIGPSTGVVINDSMGFERSGYGLLTVNGRDRVILGLDSDDGTESVVLSVHDQGVAGLSIRRGSGSVFVGSAPAGSVARNAGEFLGLQLRRGKEVQHEFNIAEPKVP